MSIQEPQEPISEHAVRLTYPFTAPLIVLVSVTLATQLAAVAYTAEQNFSAVLLPSMTALLIITIPLATLGLWLGRRFNLGAPLLADLVARQPGAGRHLARDAVLAIGVGLSVGAFLWILRIVTLPYLPPELPELGHRGAIGGLLVSISAAVGEEVWLRLGVMTIFAWLISRVLGQSKLRPQVAWTAIVLAAVAFGAIHLPQLAGAGAATSIGVTATMLGNTLVGIVCGWLYWQRSLIAAILAHLSIDIVLHVLPALLG